MTYEELLILADYEKLVVKEKELPLSLGRIKGNRIAINKEIETTTEKACVLAEELGHYHTSVGDIIDQSIVSNRKQERKARMWAFEKQIGLAGIIEAYHYACTCLYDMAEYLGVTESFLIDALEYYRQRYGVYTFFENHIVYFEPNLGVVRLFRNRPKRFK